MDTSLSYEEKLQLKSWGLGDKILKKYEQRGVTRMFPWQFECLTLPNVLKTSNLVYSAPTSAGKTLVAEILAIKTILEAKKQVLFVVPFVSVAKEKTHYFQDILSDAGIRVEGFMGSLNPPGGFKVANMAVATIEKANSIINRLIEEDNVGSIGCIVIDEMHLIGDPNRGYLLEILLTKLRYVMSKNESIQVKIVGMSATLANIKDIAKWLDAACYRTEFRPIPLEEYIVSEGSVLKFEEGSLQTCRTIEPVVPPKNDPQQVISLCVETILSGHSTLMFCPSKHWCEVSAHQIACAIKDIGSQDTEKGRRIRERVDSSPIADCLLQLKLCPAGLEPALAKCISFGVGFHHAGLTMEEREIVEHAFRANALKVLVATSTLSSGVNLPARRVIIRSPNFQGRCMDVLTYKQMIGRAGRLGKDEAGESYIICSTNEISNGRSLLTSTLPPVNSCLLAGNCEISMDRALVEAIASGVVKSFNEALQFSSCSLMANSTEEKSKIVEGMKAYLDYLHYKGFFSYSPDDGSITPSSLGAACFTSSLPPSQALKLIQELYKAGHRFDLLSDLHSLYQVTPYSVSDQWPVEWEKMLNIWVGLKEDLKSIGKLVGVSESFLSRAAFGSVNFKQMDMAGKASIHKRFYTALALQDLISEIPLCEVASKYGCNKGMLQSLQQSAATFAGMVTNFCSRLGWTGLEVVLEQMSNRIQFGVRRELLDLLKIECMTPSLARVLYNIEITSVAQLATSPVHKVVTAVSRSIPYTSEQLDSAPGGERTSNQVAGNLIYLKGQSPCTPEQAAHCLISSARAYLKAELGAAVKWIDDNPDAKSNLSQGSASSTVDTSFPKNSGASSSDSSEVVLDTRTHIANQLLNESRVSLANQSESIRQYQLEANEEGEKDQVELDSNWGGESLLEYSMVDRIEKQALSQQRHSSSKHSKQLPSVYPHKDASSCSLTDSYLQAEFMNSFQNRESQLNTNAPGFSGSSRLPVSGALSVDKARFGTGGVKLNQRGEWNPPNLNDEITGRNYKGHGAQDFCPGPSNRTVINDNMTHRNSPPPDDPSDTSELGRILINSHVGLSLVGMTDSNPGPSEPVIGAKIVGMKPDGSPPTRGLNLSDGKTELYVSGSDQDSMLKLTRKLNDPSFTLVAYDAKEVLKMLYQYFGIAVRCSVKDPAVADWLLHNTKKKSLQELSETYINVLWVINGGSNQDEALILMKISTVLDLLLAKENLTNTYTKVEMPIQKYLAWMEISGFGLSFDSIVKLDGLTTTCLNTISQQVKDIVENQFNINCALHSWKVSDPSYSFWDLLPEVLQNLSPEKRAQLDRLITHMNKLERFRSVYLNKVNSNRSGRVHCLSDTFTATGRIFMSNPNLQHFPRDFVFEDSTFSLRSAFVPYKEKYFVSADFCQLELRILAHFSSDDALKASFGDEKEDVFTSIASSWHGIPKSAVTPDCRNQTKKLCYGIIYGMSCKSLAQHLGLSDQEAADLIHSFNAKFSKINSWIQSTIEDCKKTGYITTINNRRRPIPGVSSSDPEISGPACRKVINGVIQGSAADVFKAAIVSTEQNLRKRFSSRPDVLDSQSTSPTCHLVLHLHDEVIYEVDMAIVPEVILVLKSSMENAIDLTVPLIVKIQSGNSWGSLKPIAEDETLRKTFKANY